MAKKKHTKISCSTQCHPARPHLHLPVQDNDIILPITVLEELINSKKETTRSISAREFGRILDSIVVRSLLTVASNSGEMGS